MEIRKARSAAAAEWQRRQQTAAWHWWVPIVVLLIMAGVIVAGVVIADASAPQAAQIALRTQFVGRPYEVFATIEKDDCPSRISGKDARGTGCIATAIGGEFTVRAGVIGQNGGLWLSRDDVDTDTGRRVVVVPTPQDDETGRLEFAPVRASLLWAARVAETASGKAAMLVLPGWSDGNPVYQNDRKSEISDLLPLWSIDTAFAHSESNPSLDRFDVIIVDHNVGPNPLGDDTLSSTEKAVVSWSPAQWKDFGVEMDSIDVVSRDVIAVILRPDTTLTGGIYGPLPEVTDEVRREALWWLLVVWVTVMVVLSAAAFVLERMRESVSREVREARGNARLRNVISVSLFEDLDFESTRFCLWNRAFSVVATIAAILGTAAWVFATYHLFQDSPVSVVWRGRNAGYFVGGMSWVSLGLTLAVVGRLWFAARHQARFRSVFQLGNSAGTYDWPRQDTVHSGAKRSGSDIGVCFSGGGVRSAAYGLGAIQELQKNRRIWRRVKHVSAVSGGSYVAAAHAIATKNGKARAYALGSDEERHLRNHTNYLAPTIFEKWRVVAEWLSGVVVNVLVACSVLWLAASVAAVTVRSAAVVPQLSFLSASDGTRPWLVSIDRAAPTARDALFICLIGAAIFGVWSVLQQAGNRRDVSRRVAEVFVWVALSLIVLLVLVPGASLWWRDLLDILSAIPAITATLTGIAVVSWVLATLKSVLAQQQARVLAVVVGLVVPIGAVVFVSWAGWAQVGMQLWLFILCATGAALVLLRAAFLPTMRPSLHPLYRSKLASAFAWVNDHVCDESLTDLRDVSPELTITAAANYGPSPVTPPGRSTLPYVFSAKTVGLESDGASAPGMARPWLVDTSDVSDLYGRQNGKALSTMDAVAISGAAVSPTMGKRTLALYRALLAMLNIRLGVWMPNPFLRHLWARSPVSGELSQAGERRTLDRPPRHLPWFAKEVFGQHSPIAQFVYVTDGGHYDNLGLLTLFRKGCRHIVCFDAGGEDPDRFSSIAQAMMLAEAELGIRMEFSPTPDLWPPVPKDDTPAPAEKHRWLRRASSADPHPEVPKSCTYAPFWYAGDTEASVLVYCKTTITVDSAWSVKDYRIRNPNFPNIPTLSQLYDDERFEAYRELGVAAAKAAVETLENPGGV